MLKNYFLVAWRHLQKSRVYAFINIIGLSVGMAATILILLFVQFELSFDTFHEKADRTYRLSRKWVNESDGEVNLHLGAVAPVFGPLLEADYGEDIEATCRMFPVSNFLFTKDENTQFVEEEIIFAEPGFFDIFSFELLQGNPDNALTGPGRVVLSESAATRYFSDPKEAVGQQMTVLNEHTVEVTGVIADAPKNSHFHYDVLISFDTWVAFNGGPAALEDNWSNNMYYTYVTVNEGVTQERMQSQMPDFIDRQMMAWAARNNFSLGSSDRKPSEGTFLTWWPIKDIHLHSNLDSEIEPNSKISLVITYSAIAILILVIACINFMNLSTARAAKRQMEVGLRKVFGANKPLLIRQFLVEALVMSLVALVLSVFLVELALPYFNQMVHRSLSINYTENLWYYLQLVALAVVVGILAGSYPAFFLSRFNPATILKGSGAKRSKNTVSLRSVLVVGQFTAATGLLICMGVVYQQLEFLKSRDLAFEDQGVVILDDWWVGDNMEEVLTDIERSPAIVQASYSTLLPSERLLNARGGTYERDGERIPLQFRLANIGVGFDFLDTYGVELLAGRNFDENLATDSSEAFILNENAIKTMGFSSAEEAINTPFTHGDDDGRIVGVVKDFHFENAKFPITPVIFHINADNDARLSVRVAPGREEEALAWLEERYAYYNPGYPLIADWVSENFKAQYNEEDRLGQVFGNFALLAVIIGMLGLFGLALHATQARIREIGVRKVLGASNTQVVMLLSTSFSKLVLIAFVIGGGISYFTMDWWLEQFPYRTQISWATILLAGLVVLFVALATVSTQSIRAATSNPTKSLRHE
ncbi:MAG: ABC transporter permease [Bacteroidota bacterium]